MWKSRLLTDIYSHRFSFLLWQLRNYEIHFGHYNRRKESITLRQITENCSHKRRLLSRSAVIFFPRWTYLICRSWTLSVVSQSSGLYSNRTVKLQEKRLILFHSSLIEFEVFCFFFYLASIWGTPIVRNLLGRSVGQYNSQRQTQSLTIQERCLFFLWLSI